MSSIIPGFEYDIFISYRQKDNKYDSWVTEFVDNLKKELEATFKEEISVYFDINPHDGLLETHDVDATLKEKLRCLVFIPIISRTYCDPKSFAWEHEFMAFVEKATHDKFGLKVKLLNGNVASRLLPIRIHDLDINDLKMCESILSGELRGIEFIYKSVGINRPLRTKDDDIVKNTGQILYRDQVNKVALAVKDIVEGINGSIVLEHLKTKQNPIEIYEKKETFLRESGVLLDYHGVVNSDTIELIIEKLKQSKAYIDLNKIVEKKVYSILVECLENISRHSLKKSEDNNNLKPYLSVRKQKDEIIIIAGNPVLNKNKNELIKRLNQINKSDEESLKTLYNRKINKELKEDENSAGLGFILMVLKSGNRIKYSFISTDYNYSIFEIQLSVHEYFNNKLYIEQTVSSPKVIFDFDKNIYEISGESRPNDFVKFYGVILDWLDGFNKHIANQNINTLPFEFNFNFEYFNSSSAKYILELCKNLSGMRSGGHNIIVKWHYKEYDEDMLEAGKEMSRMAKLPFDYVQIKT